MVIQARALMLTLYLKRKPSSLLLGNIQHPQENTVLWATQLTTQHRALFPKVYKQLSAQLGSHLSSQHSCRASKKIKGSQPDRAT